MLVLRNYLYNHHLVVPPSRISVTISRHSSLSFITIGGSSGLHPVSSQSCLQDLFKIDRSIVLLPSSFFSIRLLIVHVVDPYSSIDTTAAWKKLHFIFLKF